MIKRGQLQISFGMIFSIIIIIAFVAVFIYAITIFMGWKRCAETGLFKEDLQSAQFPNGNSVTKNLMALCDILLPRNSSPGIFDQNALL